ncbi:Rho GTPase-activating protein 7 [Linum perenne]
MCDSPAAGSSFSQNEVISRTMSSGATCGNSETQFDLVNEHWCIDSKMAVSSIIECSSSSNSNVKLTTYYPSRIQLEKDVQRLQQQLQAEIEIHEILESAIEKSAVKLSSPSCLPHEAQEVLSTIAVLEVTVTELEQKIVSLHFQLSQERNERRLAEYHLNHTSLPSVSVCSSDYDNRMVIHTDHDGVGPTTTAETSCSHIAKDGIRSTSSSESKKGSAKMGTKLGQHLKATLSKGMTLNGLWNHPNKLSEEMVKCMKNIFISLSDSATPSKSAAIENESSPVSPRGHLSNSSWWSSSERSILSSWVQSPQVDIQSNSEVLSPENVFDPYRVRGKLSWADIGNYGLATEVSWMSVGKKQLDYASGALRKFRTLVEQLAKVNPIHLSCNEKLAFWINLYNALIMHAYLAYGVPRSDLKLFSLMQKAAYTVGGHSFSAAAIEYAVLKMKTPLHRPQIALLLALHKLKVSDEQRKCAIDSHEPLVAFALSCGMYSSPAVRAYTAKNVREELEEAQHEFIRASVGVSSRGKLLVPKLVHCFAKSIVDDSNLAVWISHYLPPNQAMFVEQCISQRRRQSLLGSRNCGILPFDSRFRYLFLPDKVSLP